MGITVNEAGKRGGESTSKTKEKAARKNGTKGGRPPEGSKKK